MKHVVVTGLGAASPYGAGVVAYWKGLTGGACAIRDLTLIDTDSFRCRIGAEVPAGTLPGSARRTRADRLAIAAAGEALADAGLGRRDRAVAGLVVGAVGGGMLEAEAWYWRAGREGARPAPLHAVRAVLPAAHAETVASCFGLGGPRHTVVTACSSGAVALAEAAELITDGVVDVALAGGVDAITRICFMGFNALKLLDPTPCRPFDRERRGMSIGEGAAFMVLESAARARGRGARVYATLSGHGMTTDAFHVTAPEPAGDGMVRAMREALRRAGAAPQEVQYANAHGTGTPQNDRIEACALARVFGEGGLLVSSSKSMIGHTMAAAGSLEAIATVLALEHGVVPPTANLAIPDPDVPFDCVPLVARRVGLTCAISNSFGFGGQNVTLLFRRGAA
jgi:3-oxoacyl-[acyl-carrier-protein] synthase II